MAKFFTTLAAVFLVLLALSEASGHRTTITIEEAENPRGQSCREQVQKQRQQLRHCQMYLSSSSEQSPYAIIAGNPQQQDLRECCQMLEKMDEQCRCEAVKMAVKQQQQEGGCKEEEMQQMMQEAKYLPSKCNLSPRECQIRAVWF